MAFPAQLSRIASATTAASPGSRPSGLHIYRRMRQARGQRKAAVQDGDDECAGNSCPVDSLSSKVSSPCIFELQKMQATHAQKDDKGSWIDYGLWRMNVLAGIAGIRIRSRSREEISPFQNEARKRPLMEVKAVKQNQILKQGESLTFFLAGPPRRSRARDIAVGLPHGPPAGAEIESPDARI